MANGSIVTTVGVCTPLVARRDVAWHEARKFLIEPISDEKSPLDDHHAHVCEGCGHIFWHDRKEIAHRVEQHRCPKCASGPYTFGYNSQREAIEASKKVRSHPSFTKPAAAQPALLPGADTNFSPSIQKILDDYPAQNYEGELIQAVAHEACRLQRDADNIHRVEQRSGQTPLVVPNTENST